MTPREFLHQCAVTAAMLTLAACGNSTTGSGSVAVTDAAAHDSSSGGDSLSGTDGSIAQDGAGAGDVTAADLSDSGGSQICAPTAPLCSDEQINDLSLFKKASSHPITNTADGSGFLSEVNSSGGGMQPTESFVYAKFTDQGLQVVAIGDQGALDSQDWDIAMRRYVIRLNSGVSGPSCVQGTALKGSTAYEDWSAIPDTAVWASETYYDASCKLVADDSGIGAPKTVLGTFWKYQNCVQMTGKVYGVLLADGRKVKLTVTGYYPTAAQATCDNTGNVPAGTAGGSLAMRWAILP